VIFTPPLVTRAEEVAQAISEEVQKLNRSKPVLAVFLSACAAPEELRGRNPRVPCYRFPETAAIALSRAVRYGEWRNRPATTPVHFEGLQRDKAASLVSDALARGEDWLNPEETAALFACYGLPLIEQRVASNAQDAGAIAKEMNCEVALKAIAPGVIHKSEAGAVKLYLRGPEQVRQVAHDMANRLTQNGHSPTGFLVQRMAEPGVEMLVGVVHDPQFGPVLACGAGGVQVELLRDVSVRLTPISKEDATEMIQSLKTYPLLDGFRGAPVFDVAALQEGLLRISAMVEDLPQIAELDSNPFVVQQQGAVILDARVRIATAKPTPFLGVR
jgi:acyl-CoA synthetase (NDP forming)